MPTWHELPPEVAQDNQEPLPEAKALERIEGTQGIVEEPTPIIDPRQPGPREEVVAQKLVPELGDFGGFGEEAVAAKFGEVPVVVLGPSQTAHRPRRLQDE